MAPQTEYVLVDPDGPCPCRSGRITADCCMAADGSFKVKYASPVPPGGTTGFSHANCYMRDTRNCSRDIATGHYFSDAVRDLLHAGAVRVSFPWDRTDGKTAVRSEDLPACILCSRHNDALSALDAVALQAFRNILDAIAYVAMKSLATKKTLCAVSGEGLELWFLKLLFGAHHAVMAAEDGGAWKNIPTLDACSFQDTLANGALVAPRGLYIRRPETGNGGGADPTDNANRITGLCLGIGPLECELIIDPAGLDLDAIRRENFYRPSGIDLIGKKRDAGIHLSGPAFATNESARLGLSDTRPGE